MKTFSVLSISASMLLLSAPLTFAADEHHPAGQAGMPTAQMGGGQEMQTMIPQMEQHMETMMQQMETIKNTDDPDIRDRLMEEHMRTMQEHMHMMRNMGGGMMTGMMGSAKQGGMMMGGGKPGGMSMESDMGMRMDRVENRMDMMQMMMDQMVQHERQDRETAKIRAGHDHRKMK